MGAFRITGAQREASCFPLVGRNYSEAGNRLTCTETLISRGTLVRPNSWLSPRTPWDFFFCKILLSCSNGSTLNLEKSFVINAVQIVHPFLSYSACLHSLASLINSFDRKGCFMTLV